MQQPSLYLIWKRDQLRELLARTTLRCLHEFSKRENKLSFDDIFDVGKRVLDEMREEYERAGRQLRLPKAFQNKDTIVVRQHSAMKVRRSYTLFRRTMPNDVDWSRFESLLVPALRTRMSLNNASQHAHNANTGTSINATSDVFEERRTPFEHPERNCKRLMQPRLKTRAYLWRRRYRRDLVMRTVLAFLMTDSLQLPLSKKEVTERGKVVLQEMTYEYNLRGEEVTVSTQWQWHDKNFANAVISILGVIHKHWPIIDWKTLGITLQEHMLDVQTKRAERDRLTASSTTAHS